MKENHFAIIMAGGIGSRFWPMSRNHRPKQFLDILGTGKTLIQSTYERLTQVVPQENIMVVTTQAYTALAKEQLPELKPDQILAEPTGRNTAPCLAYGTFKIAEKNKDAIIIASPSDHLIKNNIQFAKDLETALSVTTHRPVIMTLGIKPIRPDTGYGYIQYKEETKYPEGFYEVKLFTEKPSLEIAHTFIESGDFVWNSGIFIFSAATMLTAFRKYLPDTFDLFNGVKKHFYTKEENEQIAEIYPICKPISIDYGIMEKADNVFVLPTDFGWSDLGTWSSLYNELETKDLLGNASVGTGTLLAYEAQNNLVKVTRKDKLTVIKGVNDLIIVETDDVLLICPKSEEQTIREIVSDLRMVRERDKDAKDKDKYNAYI